MDNVDFDFDECFYNMSIESQEKLKACMKYTSMNREEAMKAVFAANYKIINKAFDTAYNTMYKAIEVSVADWFQACKKIEREIGKIQVN